MCDNAIFKINTKFWSFLQLDLDKNLVDQGPFDVIFHKLTDILAKVKLGIEQAKKQIQNFQVIALSLLVCNTPKHLQHSSI